MVDDSSVSQDVWGDIRDETGGGETLLSSLRAAYAAPLTHFGVNDVTDADLDRLTSFIRTRENVGNEDAGSAAATMIRLFNLASGRESSKSAAKTVSTVRKAPPTTARPSGRGQAASVAPPAGTWGVDPPRPQIAVQVNVSPGMSADEIDRVFASLARHIYGRE